MVTNRVYMRVKNEIRQLVGIGMHPVPIKLVCFQNYVETLDIHKHTSFVAKNPYLFEKGGPKQKTASLKRRRWGLGVPTHINSNIYIYIYMY